MATPPKKPPQPVQNTPFNSPVAIDSPNFGLSGPGQDDDFRGWLHKLGSVVMMMDPMYQNVGSHLLDMEKGRSDMRYQGQVANQTSQYLQSKGIDQGQADAMARNPDLFKEWWQKQQPNYKTTTAYDPKTGRAETMQYDENNPNAPQRPIGGPQAPGYRTVKRVNDDGTVEDVTVDDTGQPTAAPAMKTGNEPLEKVRTLTDNGDIIEQVRNSQTLEKRGQPLKIAAGDIQWQDFGENAQGQPMEKAYYKASGLPIDGVPPRPKGATQGLTSEDKADVQSLNSLECVGKNLDDAALEATKAGALDAAKWGGTGNETYQKLYAQATAWLTQYLGHPPSDDEKMAYREYLPQYHDDKAVALTRARNRAKLAANRRQTLSPRAQEVLGRPAPGSDAVDAVDPTDRLGIRPRINP